MVFDWVQATSTVLAFVLIFFGIASFCFAAAAIAIGPLWKRVLGALYMLLAIFLLAGFAGGAA
jgi:hypothetical protein